MEEWDGSPLFQFGEFILSSGKRSLFKLECDAISPEEWHSLARIALPILPAYHAVINVPTGGDAWANIFRHYVDRNQHNFLVVDDVWTTGDSMLREVNKIMSALGCSFQWHGIVLFARGQVPKNVTALFTLHESLQ